MNNRPLSDFQRTQYQFAAHVRDPTNNPAPADVEDRRMAIYRDLIYNNIESFIGGGFPVLRQLFSDNEWHALVRQFIVKHASHTPYFLEVGREFLTFLQQGECPADIIANKPFLVELAHYEWVELAVDVSTEIYPDALQTGDLLSMRPVVSPLAWNLSYQYPVHKIGAQYQPITPPDAPTFLVVYRNRNDEVRFMESNAATSRLLTLLEGDSSLTGQQALELLAEEMKAPNPQAIIDYGRDLLGKLLDFGVICGGR